MEQFLFVFILRVLQLVRGLFVPVLSLILYLFSKKLRDRYIFEDLNLTVKEKSFNRPADVAFEVSSEGELEQIKPLLDQYLKDGKFVELLYSSSSLEDKLQTLSNDNQNFRCQRLPVLSYGLVQNSVLGLQNIKSFLTAPKLIMCRYDFYPELLLYGLRGNIRFCLVSATLKNKEQSWWNKQVYKSFDFILAASKEDKERLEELGIPKKKLNSYEFRVVQIVERLEAGSVKLKSYGPLLEYIKSFDRNDRIIMGSAWANEIEVFKDSAFAEDLQTRKKLAVILPHLFNEEITKELEGRGLPFYIYKDGEDLESFVEQVRSTPGVIVLEVKGILLELYELFGHSFIGGGHGRSVHSLLEPFLAGCHVYCGPKVHRSTEYDFIKSSSPQDLTIVTELSQFYSSYKDVDEKDLVSTRRELGKSFSGEFSHMVDCLDGSL